eukprot:scaffold175390_cov21-Prasinocladus_malaysianus.AAC.1
MIGKHSACIPEAYRMHAASPSAAAHILVVTNRARDRTNNNDRNVLFLIMAVMLLSLPARPYFLSVGWGVNCS